MIADLSKKIEIRFWDVTIPMMSNNTQLRKLVRTIYQIIQDRELRNRSFLILTGSFTGFVFGLFLFLIAH